MLLLNLRQNGILDDRIINAIASFSREKFLPKNLKGFSGEDLDFKIFSDIIAPKTSDLAKMIFLGLSANNNTKNALEIGTGSGLQTALLSKIYNRVYTIEINQEAYTFSSEILKNISHRISYKLGDGKLGWLEASPFDAIYIDSEVDNDLKYLYPNLDKNNGVIIAVKRYNEKQFYTTYLPYEKKIEVKSNYQVNRSKLI